MYDIIIYEDRRGGSEIAEFLWELNTKANSDKNSRVRLKKISEYIEILKAYGTHVGPPFVKHITGTELWELRPADDRIFFFCLSGNRIILLHHFVKKSRKTPRREIEKAQYNLVDFLEREEL